MSDSRLRKPQKSLRFRSRSVIYLTPVSPRIRLSPPSGSCSSLPPGKGEQPLIAGILGFATHKACGMLCCHSIRWALTPPFHPYLSPAPTISRSWNGWHKRFFSVTLLCRCRQLSVRKYGALRCPDFPHTPLSRDERRNVRLL